MEPDFSSIKILNEIELLRSSDAYDIYQKIRGHREALRIVKGNYLQLKKHFEQITKNYNFNEFWGPDATMRVKYKRKSTHLLFNYLCSVVAISDLSRRLKKLLTVEAQNRYQKNVNKKFVEDGSNNFVRQLRNFVSHYDVLFVGVQAKKKFPSPVSTHWTVQKSGLENSISWTGSGKVFLKDQIETIDFFPLLEKYNEDFFLVQNDLYCEVLKGYHSILRAFADQNQFIADQCHAKGIRPGPPLGSAKTKHLRWLLDSF